MLNAINCWMFSSCCLLSLAANWPQALDRGCLLRSYSLKYSNGRVKQLKCCKLLCHQWEWDKTRPLLTSSHDTSGSQMMFWVFMYLNTLNFFKLIYIVLQTQHNVYVGGRFNVQYLPCWCAHCFLQLTLHFRCRSVFEWHTKGAL